ncbi:hypothetical protein AGMMS49975_24830 [Clostridia bacterium]|nr:hypothetical protein AGMMS49975_24830 [Clostridia bacterium]
MSEEIPETKEIDGVLHYYSADLDEFVPEIKVHEATGVRYQLDAELMLYFEDEPYELTDEEKEIMALSDHADTYGTKYGKRWQKHIKEIYPAETGVLPARELWEVIPRKIDREAAEMKRILDQNYRLTYPKPDQKSDWMAYVHWSEAKAAEIDSEII